MRILTSSVIALFVLIFWVSCKESAKVLPTPHVLTKDDQVIEAFIYMNGCGSRIGLTEVCFVSINKDKDPSKELLENLSRTKITFSAGSRAFSDTKDLGNIRDKFTNSKGVWIKFSELKWRNENVVEFSSSWIKAGLEGGGCDYRLSKESGEWKTVSKLNCFAA